jgi:riboflavin kinase/FMN adenylyltransferase
MKIYHSLEEIPFDPKTILTIGTFDGVHKGHRQILQRLVDESQNERLRNLVITFEPHPQIIIQKPGKPEITLLTTIKERLELFESIGIENVLIIDFTNEFSKIEPEIFIEDYLIKGIGVHKVIIGYDHSFGKNRKGNYELLKKFGEIHNFEVEKAEPYFENEQIISSTLIRNLLKNNKIKEANAFLGYNYFVKGVVQFGRGMGAQLGYPTANIKSGNIHKLLPGNGVYIVYSFLDEKKYYGIANIGVRPTLTNDTKPTLEVNYLDFDNDLYEKEIIVNFLDFIRNEIKFQNTDELVLQIKKDEKYAKKFIKNSIKNNFQDKS